MAAKSVVVTGGNAGIGLALCQQLALEHGCYVFMGSRNVEKGSQALASLLATVPECKGRIEVVQIDVASDSSVAAAANKIKAKLTTPLYAIVNNAGTGLAHRGVTDNDVMETNLYGPKRMCDAFLPLLNPSEGCIVNVGSGAGPMFVQGASAAEKRVLRAPETGENVTWSQLVGLHKAAAANGRFNSYGLSKSSLSVLTMILAKQYPALKISCVSPGFIDTGIVKGYGASKPPREGTKSIRYALFAPLESSGCYYGSDALRSPLAGMRNPSHTDMVDKWLSQFKK